MGTRLSITHDAQSWMTSTLLLDPLYGISTIVIQLLIGSPLLENNLLLPSQNWPPFGDSWNEFKPSLAMTTSQMLEDSYDPSESFLL